MRALFWFLDHVPDRDRARAAMEKIGPMIFDGGMVALDPETPGEVHFPLDFAPLPGSLARGLFDRQVIDAGLDHLAAAQQPDGGWTFNWMAWSPAAEREWRGHMTVEALRAAARPRPLLTRGPGGPGSPPGNMVHHGCHALAGTGRPSVRRGTAGAPGRVAAAR